MIEITKDQCTMMLVWDNDESRAVEKLVAFKLKGQEYQYVTWDDYYFKHAKPLPESKKIEAVNGISPDEKQVGGSHYVDMSIEPWEVIERASLDFWDGNAVKYIMRHGSKNGVEDLKKAIHYIEKKINILEKEK